MISACTGTCRAIINPVSVIARRQASNYTGACFRKWLQLKMLLKLPKTAF